MYASNGYRGFEFSGTASVTGLAVAGQRVTPFTEITPAPIITNNFDE
jgi:hypothetical protein